MASRSRHPDDGETRTQMPPTQSESTPAEAEVSGHEAETMADVSADSASDSALDDFGKGRRRRSGPPPLTVKSLEEFVETIVASRLMSRAEVDAVLNATDEPPQSVEAAAKLLIEQGRLTEYQANCLRRGKKHGLVLGNYEILSKLGEGGMGMVFKARHRRMKRNVALKVLPPSLIDSADALGRFHREVEAAAKLTHPNIAAAFDADDADGVHFLVMEYVDGPNLSAYIKRVGPIPVAAALRLIGQAARGLAHAHGQGVIHRDIKPGNLLIDSGGAVKILDMGLARLNADLEVGEELTELTQSGRVMGTVDYMAPEQAVDAKRVDHRADIYSLGCTLFFLVAGRGMSPEGTLTQKLLWHQNQPPESLQEVEPDLPDQVELLYQRMVAKKPEDRQQSMEELCDEIDAALETLSSAGLEDLPLIGPAMRDAGASTRGSIIRDNATMVDRPTRTDMGAAGGPADAAKPARRWVTFAGMGGGAAVLGIVAALWLGGIFGGRASNDDAPGQTARAEQPGGKLPSPASSTDGDPESKTPDNKSTAPDGGKSQPSQDGPPQQGPPQDGGKKDDPPQGEPSTDDPPQEGLPDDDAGKSDLPPEDVVAKKADPPQPVVPYKDFLTWVFRQTGRATIDAGEGPATVAALSELPSSTFRLIGVDLSDTAVRDDDLARLGEAKELVDLDLSNTAVTDTGLVYVRQLSGLRSLDLSRTRISDEGLQHLAKLLSLLDLRLEYTRIADAGIKRLTPLKSRLEKLYLTGAPLRDEGLQVLEDFTALKLLVINDTFVSDAAYDRLHDLRPDLAIKWDGHDIQRGVAHKLLEKGGNLSLVVVLTGQEFADVSRRSDLPQRRFLVKRVDMSRRPNVDDADLELIAKLSGLEELLLGGTGITELGLKHLFALKSLTLVDLGSLPLEKNAVAALRAKLPGAKIEIRERPDVLVARYVLQRGGTVRVETAERSSDVVSISELPHGAYTLRRVDLPAAAKPTDADLARLKDLSGLEALYVEGSGITDAGVVHLSGAPALRDLGLRNTKVTSAGVKALANIQTLRQVYLDGTAVSGAGILALSKVPGITHLSLLAAPIADGDLVHLKGFERLSWLNLEDTQIDDAALPDLERLDSLTRLVIKGTDITDAGVEQLRSTFKSRGQEIELEHDPLDLQRIAARWLLENKAAVTLSTGPLVKVAALPKSACTVTKLDLEGVGDLNTANLARVLPYCPQLVDLRLKGTKLSDEEMVVFDYLKNLEYLTLTDTKVTDTGLEHLAGLKKLRVLDLSGTRIRGSGLVHLKDLDSLEYLGLGFTLVLGRNLEHIAGLTSLRGLDLSQVSTLSNSFAQHVAKLENLEVLRLQGSTLGSDALTHIGKLKNLRQLDLSSTLITDENFHDLKPLSELQRLDLSSTKISPACDPVLTSFKKLQSLDISRTKYMKPAAEALKEKLPKDCRLTYSKTVIRKRDPRVPGRLPGSFPRPGAGGGPFGPPGGAPGPFGP